MRTRLTFYELFIVALLVTLAFVSCSKKEPEDTEVYKIAAILPTSGPNAAQGIGMMNSCKVAVKDINLSGKLGKIELELVGLDDESKPATAVKTAERAAQDPKVLAVTAHWNSGCALATNPIFHKYGLVNLVPGAINSKITLEQPGDEIFRIDPHDLIIVRYAAEFAASTMNWKKTFVIDDNTFYGKSLADKMRKDYIERGGTVLGQESIQVGDKDFSALLTRIKGQNPDLIFYGGVVTEAALIRRQMVALGLKSEFLSLTGIYTQSFIDTAGKAAEGAYCVTVCPPTELISGGLQFIRSYEREKFSHPYEAWGIYGYASVQVLAEAIRRVAPNPTRRGIIEEMKTGEFETVLGNVSFDEDGQTRLITIFVDIVKDGRWIPEFSADGKGGLERFKQ